MRAYQLFALLMLLGLLFTACAPATPAVVEKEVVVEKPVIQTVIVEKEVLKEVEKPVVQTVIVEKEVLKEVEKPVVQTVIVEKEMPAPSPTAAEVELWYNPAFIGRTGVHICPNIPPKYGGTLVSIDTSHGVVTGTYITHATSDPYIFSQLLDRDDDLSLRPDLAEKWEVSKDGKVYTFYLRKDVLFHDGEKVTAQDVAYTIKMCTHKATGCYAERRIPLQSIVGAKDFREGKVNDISGVKVVDNYTIQLTLEQLRLDMIPNIAELSIWPKHIMEEIPFDEINDSPYAKHPIGSGPFKMVEIVPNQYYIVEAFDKYYAGRPYLDKIIFRIGMIASPAWVGALESGEIHVGTTIEGADRERLSQNKEIALVGNFLPNAMALWSNTEKVDKRVSKALLYALDRQAIVDGVYFGNQAKVWEMKDADPLKAWVGPDTLEYPYDVEKAKELLAEATAAGAWDPKQELRLVTWYTPPTHKAALAAMQQSWADAGITVNIEFIDVPSVLPRIYEQADFDLCYACCTPANQFQVESSYTCSRIYPDGYNIPRYCNPALDELITTSMGELDPAKQKEMWYTMSATLADDLPTAGLWAEDRRWAVRTSVCNYRRGLFVNPHPAEFPETWYLAE